MAECNVNECRNKEVSNGLCKKHLIMKAKYGNIIDEEVYRKNKKYKMEDRVINEEIPNDSSRRR